MLVMREEDPFFGLTTTGHLSSRGTSVVGVHDGHSGSSIVAATSSYR